MPPVLRKGPFRLACAAATYASVPQRTETERTNTAPAGRLPRPLNGSGR